MQGRWDQMLARLEADAVGYWRDRLNMAEELIDALQTGQIIEPQSVVRQLLLRFAEDPKWEVRKVIANGLNLVGDGIFDDLATRLLSDTNGFVKRSAEQSFRLRRRDYRQARKREAADRQLANRLTRLRQKYGEDAVKHVVALSEMRFNQLVGAVAHDLRAILANLQPAATGLRQGLDQEASLPNLKRRATRVVEGVAFIQRCAIDMERYSESPPVERRAEDLTEVLRAACELAAKNIEELGFDPEAVVLRQHVPDGLRLRMARQWIILAISNLVKNAYEAFMARHKHLQRGRIDLVVEAGNGDGEIQITISDNGMGMAPEHLDDLASGKPGRRNKAKRKSTGFGVPIARRYIEAHGGTLTFESSEDAGTTALIILPRTAPDDGEGEP